ncbi:hypothetical protein [Vallitalea guaymasensis]|uniref:hypothetical protein n=1 Tax=Vallitalea guaymasensis TaxID=1185412 RepID=UPI000DE4CBF5|nr:hypothetical protein [Vallitalea guaymasensis]
MNLIEKLNMYLEIILYIIMALVLVGIGIWFYIRSKPNSKQKEDTTDYSQFPKKSSEEFVIIGDIADNKIVMDNGTRYVSGVKCNGFDYNTAREDEKLMVQANYINLFNMIDNPIQFYLQCQDVDVEHIINNHQEAKQKVLIKLEKANIEFENLQQTIKELKDGEGEELVKLLDEAKKRKILVQKTIDCLTWDYRHLEELIAYIKTVSENREEPQRNEYYFFSYKFNPLAFSVNLTKGEIEKRAATELKTKAENFKSILRSSKVSAEMVDKDELIEIVRRHYNPISANIYKSNNIKNSNFFDMVTTTDYFDETKEKYIISEALKMVDKSINEQNKEAS